MKTFMKIAAAACAALFLAAFSALGQDGNKSESFNVGKGGNLEITVGIGDIRVSSWEKNVVSVNVDGLEDEDLKDVKMSQEGNTVRVSFRSRWNDGSDHVSFSIKVPSQFNLDMNTSGGDLEVRGTLTGKVEGSTSGGKIKLGDIAGGPVEVSTSGGDIVAGKIDASLSVHTSGGDIQIESAAKSLDAKTSGGDVRIGYAGAEARISTSGGDIHMGDIGGDANISTSGGNIKVGKVSGKVSMNTAGGDIDLKGANGRVVARTAGGDLDLQNVTGSIDGKTAGGEVEATLIPSGKEKTRLSSAGGEVRIYVDENAKATIEATIRLDGWGWKKSRYIIKSEFPKESYETDEDGGEIHAVYQLNGGGELIELNTSNSNIEIHKLHK